MWYERQSPKLESNLGNVSMGVIWKLVLFYSNCIGFEHMFWAEVKERVGGLMNSLIFHFLTLDKVLVWVHGYIYHYFWKVLYILFCFLNEERKQHCQSLLPGPVCIKLLSLNVCSWMPHNGQNVMTLMTLFLERGESGVLRVRTFWSPLAPEVSSVKCSHHSWLTCVMLCST